MAIEALDVSRGTLRESSLDERLRSLGVEVLTGRLVRPGVRAGYLVVAPSGVWVIASRRYAGRPTPQGGTLSRRIQTLQLGARSAARLVESVSRQAAIVQAELGADISDVPVSAMLCILDADWPIFGGAFTVDGVRVLWPKKACDVIATADAVLDVDQVRDVHDRLAAAFPAAPARHSVRTR